jgi:hypothetical protein
MPVSRIAAPVGKSCDEQRVHRSVMLESIQDLLYAFIHEGNRPHLDAGGFSGGRVPIARGAPTAAAIPAAGVF